MKAWVIEALRLDGKPHKRRMFVNEVFTGVYPAIYYTPDHLGGMFLSQRKARTDKRRCEHVDKLGRYRIVPVEIGE